MTKQTRFDRLIKLAIRLHTIADYPEPGQVPEVALQLRARAASALEEARGLVDSFKGPDFVSARQSVIKTTTLLKQPAMTAMS